MTVTAISADGTQHQFPDGTNPVVIDKVMKQYAQGPGVMGTLKDVGQSALTGLSKGAAAVAGAYGDVRNMAANAMQNSPVAAYVAPVAAAMFPQAVQVVRRAPSSGQVNAAISNILPYHAPQTTAGKYAETIASFAPAAAAGGESSLLGRAAQVVIPGAASEAAGEATQGTPLEPYARAAGAIAGGVATAVGPAAVNMATRSINRVSTAALGHSFLDPDQQAAQTLARAVASGPGGAQGAAQRAAGYGAVGASAPTAVDVGGNQTMRLARAAALDMEGNAQNTAQTYADQVRSSLPGQTVQRAMALTPNERRPAAQVSADIAKQQGEQATRDYPGPYSQPATLTPDAVSALQGQAGRAAIRRAMTAADARRDPQQMSELQNLLNAEPNQPMPQISTGTLHRINIAMRERADLAAGRQGAGDIASGLKSRTGDIRQAIAQTPGMDEANAAYRASAADQSAIQLGQEGPATTSDEYAAQLANLAGQSPKAQQYAGVGYRQAITDKLRGAREGNYGPALTLATTPEQTANLAATFGPKDAADFQTALKLEVARARTATAITPGAGSQTAPRLLEAGGLPLYTPTGAAFWLARKFMQGTATPEERAAIVRMATDSAQLRQVLAQAAKIRRPTLHGPAAATAIGFQQQANP